MHSSDLVSVLPFFLFFSVLTELVEISEDQLACCGAYDCESNTTNTTALAEPSKSLVYTLLGVYTGK